MKFLLLMLFSLSIYAHEPSKPEPYAMECRGVAVGDGMYRCENDEVYCYKFEYMVYDKDKGKKIKHASGLECFKTKNKCGD